MFPRNLGTVHKLLWAGLKARADALLQNRAKEKPMVGMVSPFFSSKLEILITGAAVGSFVIPYRPAALVMLFTDLQINNKRIFRCCFSAQQ